MQTADGLINLRFAGEAKLKSFFSFAWTIVLQYQVWDGVICNLKFEGAPI